MPAVDVEGVAVAEDEDRPELRGGGLHCVCTYATGRDTGTRAWTQAWDETRAGGDVAGIRIRGPGHMHEVRDACTGYDALTMAGMRVGAGVCVYVGRAVCAMSATHI